MANPSQPRGDRGRFVTTETHRQAQTDGRRAQVVERIDPAVREALQRHVNDRAG